MRLPKLRLTGNLKKGEKEAVLEEPERCDIYSHE
jgi:hypothetical protein